MGEPCLAKRTTLVPWHDVVLGATLANQGLRTRSRVANRSRSTRRPLPSARPPGRGSCGHRRSVGGCDEAAVGVEEDLCPDNALGALATASMAGRVAAHDEGGGLDGAGAHVAEASDKVDFLDL